MVIKNLMSAINCNAKVAIMSKIEELLEKQFLLLSHRN